MYTAEMHMASVLTILHTGNIKQGSAINPCPLETCCCISVSNSVLLLQTQKTKAEKCTGPEVISTRVS